MLSLQQKIPGLWRALQASSMQPTAKGVVATTATNVAQVSCYILRNGKDFVKNEEEQRLRHGNSTHLARSRPVCGNNCQLCCSREG